LADGTQVEADVVVLATGYRPLNEAVQKSLAEAKIPKKNHQI